MKNQRIEVNSKMMATMMKITQVYEIDLVLRGIVSIVYVSFYLNATLLLPMPFVVLSYTSKNIFFGNFAFHENSFVPYSLESIDRLIVQEDNML